MCGIAAFSLVPGSKVNARALGHALLTQIESRGSHASGFSFVDLNGDPGIYKQPKPGSQLSMAEMPRKVKSAILHTRYATQGLPSDNRNNHPVLSTDKSIALVHNGVISNDHLLRADLGMTLANSGEVDSAVIPNLIAQGGVKALAKLSGYAAIAWIDGTEGNGVIRIMRLKTSPVAFTHLSDGSFVMASTPQLLRAALEQANIEYGAVFELGDSKFISVYDGWIYDMVQAPAMSYNSQAYSRYSGATSGGHGTTPTTPRTTYTAPGAATKSAAAATPAVTTPASGPAGAVGSEVVGTGVSSHPTAVFPKNLNADGSPKSDDDIYKELEEWRQKRDKEDANTLAAVNKSLAAQRSAQEPGSTLEFVAPNVLSSDADWENYVTEMEAQEDENTEGESCSTLANRYLAGEGFYIVDDSGDMSHYPTLDDLEKRLAWIAKMGKTDQDLFQVNDNINWVNHILDLGSVDSEGSLDSWIDDMGGIDDFEMPAERNLQYIREGAGRLVSLKGA